MKKTSTTSSAAPSRKDITAVLEPAAAVFVLLALAVFLYQPHWFELGGLKLLYPLNSIIGAIGCYMLTRRWMSSLAGSLLAGMIYGFSPFALSFAAYHPLAGLLYAAVPWLFCPAVYFQTVPSRNFLKPLLTALLAFSPFVIIIAVCWTSAHLFPGTLFVMPNNRWLDFRDFLTLLCPLDFAANHIAFGFFHVGIIASLLGLFVFTLSRRWFILPPVTAGLILSLGASIFDVPPILWASIPALFIAALAGIGFQAMAWSGASDNKWIWGCASAAVIAAGLHFLGIGASTAFHLSASVQMFLLAAGLFAATALLAKFNIRWPLLRWILICAAAGYDIILGAAIIIDKVL